MYLRRKFIYFVYIYLLLSYSRWRSVSSRVQRTKINTLHFNVCRTTENGMHCAVSALLFTFSQRDDDRAMAIIHSTFVNTNKITSQTNSIAYSMWIQIHKRQIVIKRENESKERPPNANKMMNLFIDCHLKIIVMVWCLNSFIKFCMQKKKKINQNWNDEFDGQFRWKERNRWYVNLGKWIIYR